MGSPVAKLLVNYPTRWSLYCPLGICISQTRSQMIYSAAMYCQTTSNFFGLSAKFLADNNAESAVHEIWIMKVDSQKVVTHTLRWLSTIWRWKLWIFIIYALLSRNFATANFLLFEGLPVWETEMFCLIRWSRTRVANIQQAWLLGQNIFIRRAICWLIRSTNLQ